ncbi:hypothetical protein GQ55_1G124900 [Panicum hallii var. hallii]|uniref:Uncharacterized protein n=1 Tax=Panicum hallii var. hallii TaxID=1504633 RepID=A0A2T7F505_9POAL|nr:hypothetical protein GQ55_1G124900 [Panicum hallii var. hallii]
MMNSPGDAAGSGWRRRRSRKRRGNRGAPSSIPPPGPEETDDSPSYTSSEEDRGASGGDLPLPPRRVICHSTAISQREERLAERAVILSVIADRPKDLVERIIPAIAHRAVHP